MKYLSLAVPLAVVALLAAGCGTLGPSRGAPTATIPQSLLGSVPCLSREAEAQFGVTPEVVENTARWTVLMTLKLPPQAGKPVTVRYNMVSPDGRSTRVRYEVDAPKDRIRPLELDAFDPIERCAGTKGSGR
jgi:hypothetical protein